MKPPGGFDPFLGASYQHLLVAPPFHRVPQKSQWLGSGFLREADFAM